MSNGIWEELAVFLKSMAGGMIILVVYDILRIFRRVVKHGVLAVAAEDLLYWIACSIFLFRMLYRANDGIIRWFCLFGIALGMVIYNFSISRYFVKGVSWLLNRFLDGIIRVLSIVFRPFVWVFRKIKKMMGFFNKKRRKIAKKSTKRLKKAGKEFKIFLSKH